MGILKTDRNSERPIALFQFTQGIEVDRRLAPQEIQVQLAWARALASLGVLSPEELKKIAETLDEASLAIAAGTFPWRVEDEDIHMNLERFVTERHGDLGKKMHLGRSRNDLIATTLRLWVRDTQLELAAGAAHLIESIATLSEAGMDVIVPGLTHLQHGQPIRFGHAFSAHGWALLRDVERMRTCASRGMRSMPAGAAALAGTSLSVDLEAMARELGFSEPAWNSYDSVADRDGILEGCDAIASLGVHLSRLSEDVIHASATAVGLLKLPKRWSTGSSIMPNKRNPDVAELTRGKSAHLIAAATEARIVMKGVATSYGSDLHEIKSVYLRSVEEARACLAVLPPFVAGLEVDSQVARALCRKGHILATEVADHLSSRGVPFRDAYSQVAALVERADQEGCQIEELKPEWVIPIAPALDSGWLAELSLEAAVEKRSNRGGTARPRALDGVAKLRERVVKTLTS